MNRIFHVEEGLFKMKPAGNTIIIQFKQLKNSVPFGKDHFTLRQK